MFSYNFRNFEFDYIFQYSSGFRNLIVRRNAGQYIRTVRNVSIMFETIELG
jgi:hypothetical protein